MVFNVDSEREKALIERLRQGERPAFDALVEMYRNRGLNIAYSLVGNLEDAKDVLQEAFIKVYLNIKNFREESQFSTWFYRIVVNCGQDFLRKRKKTNRVFTQPLTDEEGKEQEVPDLRYGPIQVLTSEELSRNLDNCIAALPEKQRTCFILKHQNGLTNHEIARVIGCELATVKVHLFRAVKNLQDKLLSLSA